MITDQDYIHALIINCFVYPFIQAANQSTFYNIVNLRIKLLTYDLADGWPQFIS